MRGQFYIPGMVVILITVFIYVCSNLVPHVLVINWNLHVVNGVSWWVSGGLREVGLEDTKHKWLISEVTLRKELQLQGASWAGEAAEMTQALRTRVTCSWLTVSRSNNWGGGGGDSPWKNLEWTYEITEWSQWRGGACAPHPLVYLILQSPRGFLCLRAITCR